MAHLMPFLLIFSLLFKALNVCILIFTKYCFMINIQALGFVVSEKKIFLFVFLL